MDLVVSDDASVENDTNLEPDTLAFVERYVGLWNEPERETRRQLIRELWTDSGEHVLDPPDELRDSARRIGFDAPALEARGHAMIEARVTRAFDEFVAAGEYAFRSRGNAARLRNVVKFNWEMITTAVQATVAVGLDVLILDDDGRIIVDYQFVEP